MPKFCKVPEDVKQLASSAGMEIVEDANGRYVIRSASEKATVGAFNFIDEARDALHGLFTKSGVDLDGGLPVTLRTEVARSQPLKPQDTLSPGVFKSLQAGLLKRITPQGKWMEALEDIGHGAPASKIYEPTQGALREAQRRMASVIREGLGGKTRRFAEKGVQKGRTFTQAIEKDLNKAVADLNDAEQARLITLKREAFTKDEIASRMKMNAESVEASNRFAELGVADDIPRLMSLNQLIETRVASREAFLRDIAPAMEAEIRRGRVSDAMLPRLQRLRATAENLKTRDDVIGAMGLSQNEVEALNMLKTFEDIPEYNIAAIFRHATSPKLKEGFKNGQEQFVKLRGMNKQAEAIDQERWRIIEEAFKDTDVDPELVVGIHLPIMRKFAEVGIFPARGRGNTSKLSKMLAEELPEGNEILTRRVLSGQGNPHELDPVVTTFKHVRNVIFRDTLDKVMPAAIEEANHVARINPTAGKFITDYLNEIEGLPIESWQRLNESLQTTMRLLGVNVHSRSAEQVTNLLAKLAYNASIPFRPALVLRNFTQSLFMTAPIVGPRTWWESTKYVSDPKHMRAALDYAVEIGAIVPDVNPVFGATEIMGLDVTRLTQSFGTGKLAQNVDNLFKMGFSVYRSADDWGRAIAADAGRRKVREGVAEFVKTQRTVKDLAKLKRTARIGHFSDAVQREFDDLIRAENWTDAENLIARKLADKTHFLYGHSNHPVGWGGVFGRLFGQFGTFPAQYASYLIETSGQLAKNGHMRELGEFVLTHGAINSGVVYAGAEVMGADLTSWATFPSLRYSGGPYADVFVNLVNAYGGSEAQRNIAQENLKLMFFPTFDNPETIWTPGSYFLGDLVDAMNENNELRAVGEFSGLRFLQPNETSVVHRALERLGDVFN